MYLQGFVLGQVLLGSASFDIATCSGNPTGWTAMNQVLGGDAKAKGTVTLHVRPYRDTTVKVVEGIKLRNADGYKGATCACVLGG